MAEKERARSLNGRKADFLAPGTRYRSLPFWGWNDRIEAPEAERQIGVMRERGLGGFFIHSREGLETEYLGESWMEAVKAAVRKAREIGLEPWIYDEDRWPSGFAGNKVPARGDDCRAKGLTLDLEAREVPPEALAAYAIELEPGAGEPRGAGAETLYAFRRLSIGPADGAGAGGGGTGEPRPGELLAVLRREVSAPSDWFNGEAPPDNLNPDCVDAFLETTHEAYKKALCDLECSIGGFFYDEPGIHDRHASMTPGRGWVPWSDGFAAFYRERRGADFFDTAPLLFFDGEGAPAARHDYWRTVTERFSEAFTRRIGDWCRRNGVASTGHFLWENDLGVATRVCGAIMPNYRYQDMPGIDILGMSDAEVVTVKQCASVANQLGKERVISECYDATGWELGGDDQKWQGDWQYALGVTVRCQHNILYSLRGQGKRDYPPSFGDHNPAMTMLGGIEAYFARISAALTGGQAVREILVLHPASTAWARLGTSPRGFAKRGLDRDIPAIRAYGELFNALLRRLVEEHRDCDLGDEIIMAEEASVVACPPGKARKANRPRALLQVGRAAYKVIVLPDLGTILGSTLELLEAFAAADGAIIALGNPPSMVEGRPSASAMRLFRSKNVVLATDAEALFSALDNLLPRVLSVEDEKGGQAKSVWCMLKDFGDSRALFLTNRDRLHGAELTVRTVPAEDRGASPETGADHAGNEFSLEEWDPYTGAIVRRPFDEGEPGNSGDIIFRASLGPNGSRLFVFRREGGAAKARPEEAWNPLFGARPTAPGEILRCDEIGRLDAREISLIADDRCPRGIEISLTMPNALVLDRASARVGPHGAWGSEKALWEAQEDIREALGMRPIWRSETPQRYTWVRAGHPRDGVSAFFRFRFSDARANPAPLELAAEASEDIRSIMLNEKSVEPRRRGWYLDRSMERIALPAPRRGSNDLVVEFAYREASEIEDCALVGEFGVDASRRITGSPRRLALGDWTSQKLFHYPGSVVYTFRSNLDPRPDQRWWLVAGEMDAAWACLRVNGEEAGLIRWKDEKAREVTRFLRRGSNRFEIEVAGGPRNFFGPFHKGGGAVSTVDWMAFRTEDATASGRYEVVPRGLVAPPRLLAASTSASCSVSSPSSSP